MPSAPSNGPALGILLQRSIVSKERPVQEERKIDLSAGKYSVPGKTNFLPRNTLINTHAHKSPPKQHLQRAICAEK